MIGKSAFWLGITVLLTPREPDTGLAHSSVAALPEMAHFECGNKLRIAGLYASDVPTILSSLKGEFQRRAPQIRADIQYALVPHQQQHPRPDRTVN